MNYIASRLFSLDTYRSQNQLSLTFLARRYDTSERKRAPKPNHQTEKQVNIDIIDEVLEHFILY